MFSSSQTHHVKIPEYNILCTCNVENDAAIFNGPKYTNFENKQMILLKNQSLFPSSLMKDKIVKHEISIWHLCRLSLTT